MTEHIIDFVGKYLSGSLGYVIIFLACFSENSVGLGLVVPGETLVVLGGVYASAAAAQFLPATAEPLWLPTVMLVAILGAILGDNTGYLIGRRWGRPILEGRGPRWLFPPGRLKRTEEFYRRQGGKTVFLGRFVPVARAFGCLMAGFSKMPWARFSVIDGVGAVVWACLHTLLGFFLGGAFLRNKEAVEGYLHGFGVVILLLLVLLVVVSKRLAGRRRARRGQGSEEEES